MGTLRYRQRWEPRSSPSNWQIRNKDSMNRTTVVIDRIAKFCEELGPIPVYVFDANTWAQIPGRSVNEQFGFTYPMPGKPAAFCPELIAEQTEFLDDTQFNSYMDILEYVLALHIARAVDDVPFHVRRMAIDEELWGLRQGAMTFFSNVQMKILDAAAGST